MKISLLPPEELRQLAIDLKHNYNLVLTVKPVEVVLDESQYGVGGFDNFKESYAFYRVYTKDTKEHKKGDLDFITVRNGDGTTLSAVTKHQYKLWKSYKIISQKRRFHIGSAFRQLCHENDLITPW
jgi:hypothetical protein